jgi:DNA-binding NtrC family response regulator
LRERREDVGVLAMHFLQKAALASARQVRGITPEALEALKAYAWPGNIRQLEWAIERAVVLGESDQVEVGDLPQEILQPAGVIAGTAAVASVSAAGAAQDARGPVIPEVSWEEHEKAKILEALERTNWNITRAAQLLGMTFRTLQYRLEKFGIKKPQE